MIYKVYGNKVDNALFLN